MIPRDTLRGDINEFPGVEDCRVQRGPGLDQLKSEVGTPIARVDQLGFQAVLRKF